MNPKYPIYIVSKSRWDTSFTAKALYQMKVPYYVVVEESQYQQYKEVIKGGEVLIFPQKYLDEYDTFDDLGFSKSKGPGAARNFAWDHSIQQGYTWHWVMDDNIRHFERMNHNNRVIVETGSIFKAMEDFVERYENVVMAGPHYRFFAIPSKDLPAFILNTRIYSCNLIRNDIPYRWRGRYNEDTDLSLRILKDGYCTIQFLAFLQEKLITQSVKGGNTEAFYAKEGTYTKSKMLVDMHPDVTQLVQKFGRWHHEVNYRPFKKNKLIRKKDFNYSNKINEYGMKLITLGEE